MVPPPGDSNWPNIICYLLTAHDLESTKNPPKSNVFRNFFLCHAQHLMKLHQKPITTSFSCPAEKHLCSFERSEQKTRMSCNGRNACTVQRWPVIIPPATISKAHVAKKSNRKRTCIGAGRRANISFLAPFVYPFMLTRTWIPSWWMTSAAFPLQGTYRHQQTDILYTSNILT